jgi:3-deoxy-manno-octulosonate cytidylyltransferase (CMP-KDO synthetase)
MNKKTLGIIPARFASTRFPGKPLHLIAGKPLVQHVIEQCRKSTRLTDVIVATDDQRIADVTSKFCQTVMTRSDHPSGTDRIAEAAEHLAPDYIVNIQGDEPLISPILIDQVADLLHQFEMSTAAVPITSPEALTNPNVVKVVINKSSAALYFSRSPIPHVRDLHPQDIPSLLLNHTFLHHLGIYGFRASTLKRFVSLPVSKLENLEKLEQLRALENGIQIGVIITTHKSHGVDTPEDVAIVEKFLNLPSTEP